MLTPPPPLYGRVPGISPAIEQVVLTALAKDPKERFASVQAFATALEQACLRIHSGSPTPPFGDPQLLSQSSQPTYITPPRQSSQPPMMTNTPQLTQSSQPTYITPSGQSSRSTATNNPQSTYATAPSASESPMLPLTDQSLDKAEPSRQGVSRRTVVVGLAGIVGLGVCGGAIAWVASGGLQKRGFIPSTPTVITPRPDPQPSQPLGTILVTYRGHAKAVWTAAWSPNGQLIASGGDDGTVQIWNRC